MLLVRLFRINLRKFLKIIFTESFSGDQAILSLSVAGYYADHTKGICENCSQKVYFIWVLQAVNYESLSFYKLAVRLLDVRIDGFADAQTCNNIVSVCQSQFIAAILIFAHPIDGRLRRNYCLVCRSNFFLKELLRL